ncbi:hypothetical protein X797_000742 [Metarhizium robertsii]|uniref:FAD-dependent oxidoreductase-like enzyme n=2 Tax=Metarhizium robertsii TaxID=568076 RepID=E9EQB5_METRA|nr:FAD-dependent oxidoreductase-like enzyme [Metarhizium robertsii ARSEF 23]EFZ02790.1 FAD-dependent oxidoreductase-like enzyme [Metarhizium robertsii ARSEF 23]EXV06024.1 hypothetical protein X797_000742 [Metarhizium robertsii]
MASQAELDARQSNADVASPIEPSTPEEVGPLPVSSQVTLPSTEIPGSPIDPDQSFKTEANDEQAAAMVIPSSLTPPPSTQVAAHNNARRTFSQSQQSAPYSPPATILSNVRDREVGTDYAPPSPDQVLEAPADELRCMLQTCIAEQQKLKMETAHHKLQYNLLRLQAEDDAKRAAVEHEMIRREVDALRMAEHSRQARRELSTASDSTQAKYLQMKMWYEAAMEENETLARRLKVAKKVIQQKEEETMCLTEERDLLLTRIRENREHFHMLCSPGGIFHSALTPKQQYISTPQQQHRTPHGGPHQTPRSSQRGGDTEGREHGLSALLQAMSQSQDNNSAPSTPMTSHRAVQKHSGRHNRNAQSLSSLPTTPVSRSRDGGLLPSADLVPQTEPRHRHGEQQVVPTTPNPKRDRRRKSRESTISADDNEELARQALESVEAMHSFTSQGSKSAPQGSRQRRRADEADGDGEVFDSQASQAATEMLRRHPGRSFGVAPSAGSRDASPGPGQGPVEQSAKLQARLLSSSRGGGGAMDKRKFSGNALAVDDSRREHGSPPKKLRAGSMTEEQRVGLGIQYSR